MNKTAWAACYYHTKIGFDRIIVAFFSLVVISSGIFLSASYEVSKIACFVRVQFFAVIILFRRGRQKKESHGFEIYGQYKCHNNRI